MNITKLAWILYLLVLILIFYCAKIFANDDRVYVNCGTLQGSGDVVIWLGDDKYVIPVECK